jgi:hypothetical protein
MVLIVWRMHLAKGESSRNSKPVSFSFTLAGGNANFTKSYKWQNKRKVLLGLSGLYSSPTRGISESVDF